MYNIFVVAFHRVYTVVYFACFVSMHCVVLNMCMVHQSPEDISIHRSQVSQFSLLTLNKQYYSTAQYMHVHDKAY